MDALLWPEPVDNEKNIEHMDWSKQRSEHSRPDTGFVGGAS